jgi:hypothetical protein
MWAGKREGTMAYLRGLGWIAVIGFTLKGLLTTSLMVWAVWGLTP